MKIYSHVDVDIYFFKKNKPDHLTYNLDSL